jgi:TRAP-type C4-dicarboxylate transport system permease small subunit
MPALIRLYSHLCARISMVSLILAGIGLVAMTVIVAWTVFGRYVLNNTPAWGEPVSLFLMLWFILLGGAVGVRELDHMGFDIGLHYARGIWKRLLVFVNEVLVATFGFAMFYYGWTLAAGVWSDRIPVVGISKGWDYVPIAVGGVLVLAFSLEKILLTWANQAGQPMPFVSEHKLGEG